MWLRGLVLSLSIVLLLLLFFHIQSGDKGVLVNLSLESDVQSGDIDSECARDVKLGEEGQFPNVFLTSFPGSGNTWARTLVEDITGYYTGSVYVDKSLGREGLLGEYEDPHNGRTIAIKAHGMNGMAKKAAGVILLIRNPFDAMLSEFNRRESADHTGSADISLFNTTLWEKRITSYTSRWFTLHQKYAEELQSSQCLLNGCSKTDVPVFIVLYENLRECLQSELGNILTFLKATTNFTTADQEKRIECAVKRNEIAVSFKRKKERLGWEVFTPAQIELINHQLDEINKIFLQNGFQRLPDNYYKPISLYR